MNPLNPGMFRAMRDLAATVIVTTMLLAVIPVLAAGGNPGGGGKFSATAPVSVYTSTVHAGSVVVNGTSTLHNWSIKTTHLAGSVSAFLPSATAAAKTSASLNAINLTISVNTLKSTEGGGMDSNVYGALHHRKNPFITYRLVKAVLNKKPGIGHAAYTFATSGRLTVAGKTRNVKLPLIVRPATNGRLVISTHVKLKMTDFGISPPTAMLGFIKSGNTVSIKALWNLVRQPRNVTVAKP